MTEEHNPERDKVKRRSTVDRTKHAYNLMVCEIRCHKRLEPLYEDEKSYVTHNVLFRRLNKIDSRFQFRGSNELWANVNVDCSRLDSKYSSAGVDFDYKSTHLEYLFERDYPASLSYVLSKLGISLGVQGRTFYFYSPDDHPTVGDEIKDTVSECYNNLLRIEQFLKNGAYELLKRKKEEKLQEIVEELRPLLPEAGK